MTSGYINSCEKIKDKTKSTFLHQLVLDHKFDGKIYVDHINRICQDNRKENLRLITQTGQNWNQKKRKEKEI